MRHFLRLFLACSLLAVASSTLVAAESAQAVNVAGGVEWSPMPIAPEVKSCELIWVHPHTSAVYAFCNKGDVYLSQDDGATWSLLTKDSAARPSGMVEQVLLDPKDDQRLYATSMYGGGAPFVTIDGGKTWKPLGPGHVDFVGVDFSDPQRKLVIASKHENHNGFIAARNGNVEKPEWEKLDLKDNTAFGAFIDIVDSKKWFLGASGAWGGGSAGVYQTVDGGQSFKLTDAPVPTYQCGFQEHDGKLYYLSGQGVVVSTDRGENWNVLTAPPQPWTLGFGPHDTAWLSVEHGLFSSRDGLKTWQPVTSSIKIGSAHFSVAPKTGTMFVSSYGEQGLRHRGLWQEKPADLIVWSGDRPEGQTWARGGNKSSMKVATGAGFGDHKRGLELHFDGNGFRGAGVNWKGWYPADACDDATPYTALVFRIRQTSKVAGADLTVGLVDNVKRDKAGSSGNTLNIVGDGGADELDSTWRRVVLPLAQFAHNRPLELNKLWEVDFSNFSNQELTFDIDQIGFAVEKVAAPRFKTGAAYAARAQIVVDKPLHAISDGIYGVCGLSREKLIEYCIPITRWGGNPSTRYNWRLGVDSAGNDWFFRNRGQLLDRLADTGYLKTIEANQVIGATTYQTVPMIGWVAKDASSYGFSVAKYGPQKATEPGNPDVGNGIRPDGRPVTGNDPRDNSVPAPPEFIEQAVRFVASRAGKADGSGGAPGVKYWALDNEPMLWNSTHRDVRPQPLGYDELWDRTVKYAEAIKRADPTAKVAGYCSWGWTDLYYSGVDAGNDNFRSRPDFLAHDKVGMAEWFIRKCGQYKREHNGRTLVDVFDCHWYPQGTVRGQGVYMGKGLNPELNALRLRSTRELWDRTYESESWIHNTDTYSPVALLPRIKKWIADNNPGMEICLGEYNFGGADNVSGGLAQAEAFGVMAREGLDLAFIWFSPAGSQEAAWQLFRNYDGAGGRFGDQYLQCESQSHDLSVFAARRTSDQAVTIAVVNKNLNSPCTLNLDVAGLQGAMRVWRFDQDSEDKAVEIKQQAAAVNGQIKLEIPAASASMLVVAPSK